MLCNLPRHLNEASRHLQRGRFDGCWLCDEGDGVGTEVETRLCGRQGKDFLFI